MCCFATSTKCLMVVVHEEGTWHSMQQASKCCMVLHGAAWNDAWMFMNCWPDKYLNICGLMISRLGTCYDILLGASKQLAESNRRLKKKGVKKADTMIHQHASKRTRKLCSRQHHTPHALIMGRIFLLFSSLERLLFHGPDDDERFCYKWSSTMQCITSKETW